VYHSAHDLAGDCVPVAFHAQSAVGLGHSLGEDALLERARGYAQKYAIWLLMGMATLDPVAAHSVHFGSKFHIPFLFL